MTYCLAIHVEKGLVFASDSRTNAGVDHVSAYRKMHTFSWPGKRVFILLSSGNLATTQAVVKRLEQDAALPHPTGLLDAPHLAAAADYIGAVSTEVQRYQASRDTMHTNFESSFIFGGQIAGEPPGLFMIYPQGNYIHEPPEHPFLQIGESKYGKPILDRIIQSHIPLELAARCAMVSMNSTIRSNVTVGPPIDLLVYETDSLQERNRICLNEDDAFYRELAERWNEGLQTALANLPAFPWEH